MASDNSACGLCASRGKARFPQAIRMAYQPIVDIEAGRVFAHEALVRGENGEGAGHVLSQITDENRYSFDQTCRVQAIETASRIGVPTAISINFMPNAVYEPANCIRTTLRTAEKTGMALDRIIWIMEVLSHSHSTALTFRLLTLMDVKETITFD